MMRRALAVIGVQPRRFSRIDTDRPCAPRPSASASASAAGPSAASASGVQATSEVRLRKSATPSPPEKRAARESAARGWCRRRSRRSPRACGGRGRSRRHGGCGPASASAGPGSIASSTCSAAMRSTIGAEAARSGTRMMQPLSRQLAPRDVGARHARKLGLDGRSHAVGEGGIVGDQDRLRGGVVLGLRQKVGGDPGGIVVAVGDDQDLRRAGDQVDADLAEHAALGGGDIGVARAGDLVDRPRSIACRRPARPPPGRRRCARPRRRRRSRPPA